MTGVEIARSVVFFGVNTFIELYWIHHLGASRGLAGAALVGLLRDRAPDPAAPQVSAVGAGPVSLVGQHPVRPGTRVPAAGPGNPDAPQHGLELGAVAALARGDHDRERLLVLLAGQV